MAIRRPKVSVKEARRLASLRDSEIVETNQIDGAVVNSDKERVKIVLSPSPEVDGGINDRSNSAKPNIKPTKKVLGPKSATHNRRSSKAARIFYSDTALEVSEKAQVFLFAYPPALGISKSYDLLSQQYPTSKALQMILRRALDNYEALLADGTFVKMPVTYELDINHRKSDLVQTSRILPVDLINVARQHFDPLGFESTRAFGRKLATAALAVFFMNER